jgi:lipopolysaccharide export system permease protein
MIINFAKLSNDYELIVLTSFGQSPMKLIKLLLPLSILFTIGLLLISFILIPQSKFLNKSFINEKKKEAQFNIQASEYGQSFGPWYIYVKEKTNNTYYDITLFQPDTNEDIFIQASSAEVLNNQKFLSLELFEGNAHSIKDNIRQIDFSKMVINNQIEKMKQLSSISDLITYWSTIDKNDRLRKHFIQNILISLLPTISIFFYLAFGYFNPRYEKNRATLYGIGLTVLYIVLMQRIVNSGNLSFITILPLFWMALSVFIYNKKVRPYY